MLGEFSISMGDKTITDSDNRSRKVWLLLAYMVYCRNRAVQPDELVELLWGMEERSTDPPNALKTMLHRVRAMLNQLGTNVGHDLIVRRNGTYAWNTDYPLTCDVDEFESLCKAGAAAEGEERLDLYLKALGLYHGDFLNKLSAESWVIPIAAYYHNIYVETVLEALPMLEERGRLDVVAALCREAVTVEPYNETLYKHLMRALLDLGEQQAALSIYEDMSQMLLDNFGVLPSEELRTLQREALAVVNDRAVSFDTVREQLREQGNIEGALFCEYDFFKIIYHAEARALARSGDVVHIAMISITDENDGVLPKRSLDRAMENMQEIIKANLRKGDIFARCSVSQFILMLPMANYENSCMVCERVTKMFCRQYPHSPAKLRYSVRPLEPNA
jgi:DNA-binding SARP family transcriptional activator